MTGWTIFAHSVRLVLSNLDQAIRVSALLYSLQVAYQVHLFLNPPTLTEIGGETIPLMDPEAVGTSALLAIVAVIASLWIAVAWHRFVLAEEYPTGWLPRWHGRNMLSYFGRSVMIGLLIALALFVPGMVVAVALPSVALVGAVFVAVGCYLFFRLGVMLPAAAMGRSMTLRESWDATNGAHGTIFGLTMIFVAATLVLQVPSLLNSDQGSVINLVYGIVTGWLATIVGISVLTTLYGHFVEGRTID